MEERWQTGTVELQKSEAHPPLGMTKAWVRVRLRSTSGIAGQSTLELETARAASLPLKRRSRAARLLSVLLHMPYTCSIQIYIHVNWPYFGNGCAASQAFSDIEVADANRIGSSSDTPPSIAV